MGFSRVMGFLDSFERMIGVTERRVGEFLSDELLSYQGR